MSHQTQQDYFKEQRRNYRVSVRQCVAIAELHRGGLSRADIITVMRVPLEMIVGDRLRRLFLQCEDLELYQRWLRSPAMSCTSDNGFHKQVYCGTCGNNLIYLPCGICRAHQSNTTVTAANYTLKKPYDHPVAPSTSEIDKRVVGHDRTPSAYVQRVSFHGRCRDDT